MNHTVFQIDPADSRFTDTFARFFTDCGEYELFSDCDTPYFAVFSDIDRTHCTGLLTFLISENESFTEAEVAAFVLPDYRRQGIFYRPLRDGIPQNQSTVPGLYAYRDFSGFFKKMCFIRRHRLHRISDDADGGKCLHGCSGFMYCKWGHSAGFCRLFKHTLHDNQLICKRFQFLQ